MRSSRYGYNSLTRFSCVVLSYSLLLSLYAPFQVSGAVVPAARSGSNAFVTTPGRPAKQRGAHRDGELIVRFRPDVSVEEKEGIVTARGARRGRSFRGASGIDKLILPAGRDPEALAAELRLNPGVEFAEPNYLITRNEIVPNDPRFGDQWALKNTGGAGGRVGADVEAPRAWEVTTGAASTVIAVIDSGVDFTHPDLRRNQWANSKESENGQDDDGNDLVDDIHGWDWVTDSNLIRDEQGHGTVIAGIIAAQGNNATGISGVMWRASLMSLRVLDATGTGDVANAVEAIDYAVEHGARVINCSWGTDAASEALKDAISRAARRGVLVVCSVGNDGRNIDGAPYYPASFELDNLIAVASTNNSDQLATWSNWGAARTHAGAPGENILSTRMGGGYKVVSGSSASAPVATGVAGLVKTLRPYLSGKLTREIILAGVRRVETLAGKVSSGGTVSAAGALEALNTLPPDEGLKEGDERGHGEGGGGNDPNGGSGGSGGNGKGNGGHRPERPVERTKGAPGLNLPNLDEVRKLRPAPPRAPAPIRSNLAPTCDPYDPNCDQCYGCEPPPPASSSPIGYLDGIGGDGGVWGWTFDPDAAAQSIDVHFYIDGPAGSGQWGGAATANHPRPDVNQAYGISGAHGYWFSIPPRFRDGQAHTLYVYGIDVTGSPNALLSGVPRSFTLNASGSITAGPNPMTVCDGTGYGVTTLSWSTSGTTEVDVRVNAPNGALFATTGPTGSGTTGKWVGSGTVFYLQNASYGDRTSAANTLATVRVGITTSGCAVSCASAGPDNAVVDYSAATHEVFAYGVQNAANVSFGVWGATGGQNDLTWYAGQNLGGGTWKATINFANHPESGPFGAHVYMNNNSLWCDSADFTRTAPPLSNAVWVEDALPAGATAYGTAEGWNWVGSNPTPYSGNVAHVSNFVADVHQHYFEGASAKLAINSGDKLYAYVYLNPNNTPSEVMLQWNDGTWEHRAYWGANIIGWGADNTAGRRYMGPLPAAGMWARLEVPASDVGLEGRTLHGMAFTLYGGQAAWDKAGAGAQSIPPGATAAFVKTDATTLGNWKGVYGADGYQIVGDSTSYPAYAQVNPSGHNSYTWLASTGEVRAPEKSAPGADRIAACWYSNTSFNIDLNLTDGRQHQVALYALDWDGANGRGQRIDIFDAATGSLLDSRSVSAFSGGQYVVWNLSGHVIIKATRTGIHNAVISGLFFSPADPATTADPTGNNFSVARLDQANRTGQPGTDLFSGNYNWGVPLVGLRGRAGLDLAVSLSYNSLVWTKDNAAIKYDADRGTPSAGFRLGFPVIESRFYNPVTNKNAYLMITPSGARVELRQVGSSNVYEAADSSYLQLIEGGTLTLHTTDGTQLSYVRVGNAYRCTQVKDRNGNYISVKHYGHGGIQTITDTLGRVVTFNYDGNNRPISITQLWNGATHTWATFGYGNISVQPGFSGLNVYGPQNQIISVLTQVGLDDGTRYNFDYSAAGQVSVIRHYAADGHQLSYAAYDFNVSGADCPRVVRRRDFARDWNNDVEAVTTYADEGGGVRSLTMPDGSTVHKEFFVMSGWRRGITTRTETWSNGLQKWTTTEWTQDDTSVPYQLNPRPVDSSVYDTAGNRRRTTIDYTAYGLPSDIREYGADGWSVLRRTHVDYRWDSVYVNQRIIGLPGMRRVYEGENTLVAKTEFHYDWGGEYFSTQTPSVQHDGLSYGASYLTGRGNLSAVRRFNKDAPDDPNQAVWQQLSGYNAAGLPVFARDAGWHTTQISYADDYAGGNNSRNILAYPTKVTDADGFSSTIRYNYDLGVATRAEGPPPAGHTQGVVTSTTYDSAGRVERVTNETSTAYTRFVYAADNKYVQSFSLLEAGVESYSIRVFDGAGRVRATAAGHPGSAGGYSAQFIKYDVMGRTIEQTNPAEITAAWIPAGDDAAGWVWSKQAYDWKGRPTVATNVDGTTNEVSYGGCGCAGGEVITLRDEVGRKQKVYADVLGRAWKSEDFNSDGSVYRTTTTTYNALDQVTRVYVQAGTSSTGQETSMTYDGFGRLSTKKTPIQTSVTHYAYNTDDTVRSVTDARGAVQTIGYNARHLMTATSYSAPADITPTAWVTFDYDAAGNRIWMDDEAGRVDYQYDRLSRLESETRQFDGVGPFQLSYSYTLGGQLQSLTDPMGSRVSYNYDGAGRVNSMSGTGFGSVFTFASDMQYRAWGALKHAAYGNTRTLDLGYNARLQPSGYSVPGVIQKAYDYHADGSLRFSYDLLNDKYDRAYEYDEVGRIRRALSGAEARDGAATDDRPYNEQLGYDVWDHLVTRQSRRWNRTVPFYPQTQNYTNDRNAAWQYDFDGNLTSDGNVQYTIDAAGRSYHVLTPELDQTQVFDGDGHRVKTVDVRSEFDDLGGPTGQTTTETRYEIRSSVLGGQLITEVDGMTKQKQRTLVYLNGVVMGWQERYYNGTQSVRWEHRDVHNGSYRMTGEGGYVNTDYSAELDPMQANAGLTAPASTRPRWWEVKEMFARSYPSFGDGGGVGTCIANGTTRPCGEVLFMLGHGLAEQCQYNNCGPRVMRDRQGREYLIPLSRDPETGQLGYNPRQWGYGTPPTLKFPGEERGKGNRNTSDASEGEESEPQKSYDNCKGLASIPEVAVNLIMEASRLEGTDPTLIAVTMKNESSFGNNLTPNPRKDAAGNPNGHYDVGWMQVATSVWDKSPYTDGLPNAFGTLSADWKTGKMLPFNGDALQNVRLGARALNASSGWRGRPKNVSPRADAAGIFRAGSRKPSSYQLRVNEFNKDYQAFDRFFNCMRGLPY